MLHLGAPKSSETVKNMYFNFYCSTLPPQNRITSIAESHSRLRNICIVTHESIHNQYSRALAALPSVPSNTHKIVTSDGECYYTDPGSRDFRFSAGGAINRPFNASVIIARDGCDRYRAHYQSSLFDRRLVN